MHAKHIVINFETQKKPGFFQTCGWVFKPRSYRPVNKGTQTKGRGNSNAGDWEDPGRKQTGQIPGKNAELKAIQRTHRDDWVGAVYIEAP